MKEEKSFKNLGEMRRFMGINNQDVFTESTDRIGRRELKRGSGNQSGIDGMLLDPMLSRLLESMLDGLPDDAEVQISSQEVGKCPHQQAD
mgnify:CR=1 FL=1|tara:strand:+ start:1482 stop:1751 length:270 start_codon:yes stop_codon:yes gene_type:complete